MLKNEKGSITVYTLIVMLLFVIILMGIYISSNNTQRTQKIADTTIIEKYQQEVNLINEIYNEKEAQYKKSNYEDIVSIKWENNNIITNADGSMQASADLITNNQDNNIDFNNSKYIINNTEKNIGINNEIWNTEESNNITSESGTIISNIEYNKTYFIHVLISYNSGKKIESVSSALIINE